MGRESDTLAMFPFLYYQAENTGHLALLEDDNVEYSLSSNQYKYHTHMGLWFSARLLSYASGGQS